MYKSYENFTVFSNINTSCINILYTLHNDISLKQYNQYNINECFSCNNTIPDTKTIIRCFDKSFCCKDCLLNPYNNNKVKNTIYNIDVFKNDDDYFDLYNYLNTNVTSIKRFISYNDIKYQTNNNESYENITYNTNTNDEYYIKKLIKLVHKIKGFISILIRLNKNTNIFNKLFIIIITLSILFYNKHVSHIIR